MPMNSVTVVTGLWNLDHMDLMKSATLYEDFEKLLHWDVKMCIYIDPTDPKSQEFIWKHRSKTTTSILYKTIDDIKHMFEFYPLTEKIRNDPEWYNQTDELPGTDQAKFEIHNPIILNKMFMLHDVKIINPFKSTYFYWVDCTAVDGMISRESIDSILLNNLSYFVPDPDHDNKFLFFSRCLDETNNIGGFDRLKLTEYCCVTSLEYLCYGKIFGGKDDILTQMNDLYYHYLKQTLSAGLMGTDECIFTIIAHKHPDSIKRFNFDEPLVKFFEMLPGIKFNQNIKTCKQFEEIKTHLYILTFNFPEQLEHSLQSFEKADINFLQKPQKFLLNNSTDCATDKKYDAICSKYGFEQIKKNNIGICGGRQFVAEHFENSDADYYIFFEDDMQLHENNEKPCNSGFRTWSPDLYNKTLRIMHREKYDFLKINFTEVYGGNSIQWAWYNVPDNIRNIYFPDKTKKPEIGFDPNPPLTQFTHIKKLDNISYVEGEIYYCNWPIWFNKAGNRKVFLDPKYEHPYEQTWMSLVFQKHKQNQFKTAVLLLSPINHNRIRYYEAKDRREN
jgi:hypothetical protein